MSQPDHAPATPALGDQTAAIGALQSEIQSVVGDVETITRDLSARFIDLARHAQDQVGRVGDLAAMAGAVDVNGERVELEAVLGGLGDTLGDFARRVVFLSKQAVVMVRTIETILDGIQELEGFVEQIDYVTGKTNMLALNARIEAERAGEAGHSFRVVAGEVRDLSKGTAELATRMKEKIHSVATALREGHSVLAEVAGVDLTREIEAKEKVDTTLAALAEQSHHLEIQAAAGLDSARGIDASVATIVTDMQFGDRVIQRLARVTKGLDLLTQIVDGTETQEDPRAKMAELLAHAPVVEASDDSDDIMLFQ